MCLYAPPLKIASHPICTDYRCKQGLGNAGTCTIQRLQANDIENALENDMSPGQDNIKRMHPHHPYTSENVDLHHNPPPPYTPGSPPTPIPQKVWTCTPPPIPQDPNPHIHQKMWTCTPPPHIPRGPDLGPGV